MRLREAVADAIRAVARVVPLLVAGACGGAGEAAPVALSIAVEVGRLGQRDLWPDFDPTMVPLAIYDGSRTVLLGHPSPPPGFERDSVAGGWSRAGLHPDVTGASSRIANVWTATLIVTDSLSHRDLALRVVHEAFHAMQRQRHPDWIPPETHGPAVADADRLAGRRLENVALSRALAARATDQAACWARAAIRERGVRHGGAPDLAALEGRFELYEGLAAYVEHRGAERERDALPLDAGFPADSLRLRAAVAGTAYGLLLDRLRPDWREQLEHRTTALDVLLTEAIGTADACAFKDAERAAARDRAGQEIREHSTTWKPIARSDTDS
jgi:hypothetical protein